MNPTKTYYSWANRSPKQFRITPKQFRLIDGDGRASVIKPKKDYANLNGILHTYTFNDGTTRQWFFTGDRMSWRRDSKGDLAHYETMMKSLLSRVGGGMRGAYELTDFGFVTHPDDKVFYRSRLVYTHTWTRSYDGGVTHAVSYDGDLDGDRRGGLPRPKIPVSKTVVVCETWVKWGRLEILLDDGLRHSKSYDIGDTEITQTTPRRGRFLSLPDFRSSRHHNPFDEPFELVLKEIRDKRNAMNEEIAQKAFHPDRVERMMSAYGEDWDERV
jgi:hypothetical protein